MSHNEQGRGRDIPLAHTSPVSFRRLAAWFLTLTLLSSSILRVRANFGCYPAFNSRHSGCLSGPGCGNMVQSGVSEEDKRTILSWHNKFRRDAALGSLGSTASNMIEMQWDDELAHIAQKWAESCVKDVDCNTCRSVPRFDSVGQNIFFYGYTPDNTQRPGDWSQPLKSWGNPKQFPPRVDVYDHSVAWGGYTQVIWANSYLVGCGYAKFLRGGKGDYTYVCNYGPAGNTHTYPIFTVGTPCTRCPRGYNICLDRALCRKGEVTTTTTTARTTTAVKIRKPCLGSCVRAQVSLYSQDIYNHCEVGSLQFNTDDCVDDEVCCEVKQAPKTTSVATTTAPTPRKCLHTCVRHEISDLRCVDGTQDWGFTSCAGSEICCKIRQPPTTPRVVATTTQRPRPLCPGEFRCMSASEAKNSCDFGRYSSVRATSVAGHALIRSCPAGQICCPPRKRVACPATHSCLPRDLAGFCQPGTTVEAAAECVSDVEVCCKILDFSPAAPPAAGGGQPSSPPTSDNVCQGTCLTGVHAQACQIGGLEVPGAQCPNGESCCALDVVNNPEPDDDGDSREDDGDMDDRTSGQGCPRLNGVANGNFRITSCGNKRAEARNMTACYKNGKYAVSTVVEYKCQAYYNCVGNCLRTCRHDGNWKGDDGDAQPFCQPSCGRRNIKTAAVFNGKVSKPGEWPWNAALYYTDPKHKTKFLCGGVLVRREWVLTAAHCVVPESPSGTTIPSSTLTVYLGKITRSDAGDDELVQRKTVTLIIKHPSFVNDPHGTFDSDIALLRLSSEVSLNHRVQLACISKDTESYYRSERVLMDVNNKGAVAGFGRDQTDEEPDGLAHIELPVVPAQKCRLQTEAALGDSGSHRQVTKNMFCAGYGPDTATADYQSVCKGDSGSPMVFQHPEDGHRWYVEGLVSYYFGGNESCTSRKPGLLAVFTKVNEFHLWIKTEISKH